MGYCRPPLPRGLLKTRVILCYATCHADYSAVELTCPTRAHAVPNTSLSRHSHHTPARYSSVLYLCDQRALFMGYIPPHLRPHRSAVSRLVVGLDKQISYCVAGSPPQHAQSLLIPAGIQVHINLDSGLLAECFLDISGQDFTQLKQHAHANQAGLYEHLAHQQQLGQLLTSHYQQRPDAETLWRALNPLLRPITQALEASGDARVNQTIARIKAATHENLSLEQLACEVGLSASRLLSLFKQQTGIPIRRYRLWRRLYRAMHCLACGASITTAALEAGFCDSAHFSRTCLELLGSPPSQLLHKGCALQIFSSPLPTPSFRPSPHSESGLFPSALKRA